MRVFVTGASGYIGHSVAKAFRAKGHTVHGLIRSQEKAKHLLAEEIWPVIGNLENPESYSSILEEVEVAVHCARDYSPKGIEYDANTIDTIIAHFSKSPYPRSFIYNSGIWIYGSRGDLLVDESIPPQPLKIVKWRESHEAKVLKAANARLKTSIIRPGFVYGGSGGLLQPLFASAQRGAVEIVGDGNNHWPMVHVQDLAYAFVSMAEKELSQIVLNVVDDSHFTLREIAEAIAKAANGGGKIKVLSSEEGAKQFGAMIEGLMIDLTVNNSRAKRLLGWQIHHPPFLYEAELYYNVWKSLTSHE